jgi:hypothetical protein
MGVGGGALVVACEASDIGIRDGGWFVKAEFVIDVSDATAGVAFTLDGLFVDDILIVSLCWPHPHSANPTRALAITT